MGDLRVMGSRPMSSEQTAFVHKLQADFEALHEQLSAAAPNSEAARLFAMARSHLEEGCLCATKAVSRCPNMVPATDNSPKKDGKPPRAHDAKEAIRGYKNDAVVSTFRFFGLGFKDLGRDELIAIICWLLEASDLGRHFEVKKA